MTAGTNRVLVDDAAYPIDRLCPDCDEPVDPVAPELRIGRTVWFWLSCGHRSLPVRSRPVWRP